MARSAAQIAAQKKAAKPPCGARKLRRKGETEMKKIAAVTAVAVVALGVMTAPTATASSCYQGAHGQTYGATCSSGSGHQFQAWAQCHYNLWPWDTANKTGNWSNYGNNTPWSWVDCGYNHVAQRGGINFR